MSPRTFVIVLTHNQWDLTRDCLESIRHGDTGQMQVVVVDNASTDQSAAQVREAFPSVLVVETGENLGYARGNNLGMQLALEQNAEYVMILNNDVTVARDALSLLIQAADNNPDAALAGPLVMHANEPDVIQSAGGVLPDDWHSYHRGANETNRGQFHAIEPADWLTGCAVLARTSALRKFGLLDEDFFMYGEDVDWGVRARHAGYRVVLVPQAQVWHSGVKRSYAPAPYVTYYSARNELQLIRKHRAGTTLLFKAWARYLRTWTSWTLLQQPVDRRGHRAALGRAMWDAVLGRTGQAKI